MGSYAVSWVQEFFSDNLTTVFGSPANLGSKTIPSRLNHPQSNFAKEGADRLLFFSCFNSFFNVSE